MLVIKKGWKKERKKVSKKERKKERKTPLHLLHMKDVVEVNKETIIT